MKSARMTDRLIERLNSADCSSLAAALGAVVIEMLEVGTEHDKRMAKKIDDLVDKERAKDGQ